MPRRNKHKTKPHIHGPTIYDDGFKQCCCGCPFAGQEFKCLSSDGKCLKTNPDRKMQDISTLIETIA